VIAGVEELCNHAAGEKADWAESSAYQSKGMTENSTVNLKLMIHQKESNV